MVSFDKWLEEKSNIVIVRTGQYAGSAFVVFSINGKRYEYSIDPQWLNFRHKFRTFMKYSPGKALNMAKTYGQLI